jgi:muramoyltetrapeptide carboxypeptidase
VPDERLDAGLAVLASWGLEVRVEPNTRGRHPDFDYLASADADRAKDFVEAWCDPDVHAVICARGGYGAPRMVDLLDWPAIAAAGPKVLVGFSDITALHVAFAARLRMSTVHGPVVTSLPRDLDSAEHLRRLLFEPERVGSLTPVPAETMLPGVAEGPLVGGNVALLAASAGTRDWVTARGAIAVLEEVGEQPYRLDRLLTHLLRAGWFEGVRGIVLGRFTECGYDEDIARVVYDRLAPLGVPMVREAQIGHDPVNLAFPLGVPAELDADAGTLTLTAPALL